MVSSQVQDQIRAIDPDLPVFDVRTVDDLLSYQRWAQRIFGSMFAIFATIALTMAGIGLHAVTATPSHSAHARLGCASPWAPVFVRCGGL